MHHTEWMGAWKAGTVHLPDHARLFAAVHEHAAALLAHYPHVAVQRLAPGNTQRPLLTAGALVTLWARWPAMTGTCPACGGRVLGTWFGGLLSRALASGVCTRCAIGLGRPIQGGIGMARHNADRRLAGTPFRCGAFWQPLHARPLGDLFAAVQELGATGLSYPVDARPAS